MNEQRPLRVLVAEDEPLARELLVDLLGELADVEVVAICDNGLDAVRAAAETKPDLLMLDIQMPKLDGFEVLELLDRPLPVIFVTAYDSYAVQAFEAQAIDYLQKPFSPERLERALLRARNDPRVLSAPLLSQLKRGPTKILDRIAVKDGIHIAVIPVAELQWVRAEDDYICLCSGGKQWLKHQALARLEEELDPRRFVRIHRSCLVNLAFVAGIEPETRDRFWVKLHDGTRLPASRAGERRLRETLGL